MELFKNNNILKIIIFYFILLLILSCSDKENHTQTKVENLLYNFHMKNSSTKELKNGIEILISKNINLKYKVLFYKIKDSNKFYFGFIDNNNFIIKIIKLKERKTISMFKNKACFVLKKESILPQESDYCFTFFIGKIPYNGYSKIELEWNCSKKDITSEKLIKGKYFFFLKEGSSQICNIKLINNEGQTENIFYNIENGLFTKKTTTNTVYNSLRLMNNFE